MAFIRLLRPINLIIIALTMYGLGWYMDPMEGCSCTYIVTSWHFFLLVISTVMIAAGGNIINDYFDVRADRINKPDKVIIGIKVKRRIAIVTHWGINFVAFSIAVYLSYIMESFWYVFIHLFSINVLWFYSMYLKRKFLTGNILIAALTAMVPLLVGVFFYQTNKMQFAFAQPEDLHPFEHLENTQYFLIYIAAFLSIFAFLLNLAREIIKDMEDVEGDKKLNAKTVPIVLGLKSSKTMIVTFLLIAFAASVGIKYLIPEMSWMSYSPFIAVNLIILIIIALTFKSQSRKELRFINHLLKLSMSVGLLTPIFWKLLMEYGS